jgi:hypothetical protein
MVAGFVRNDTLAYVEQSKTHLCLIKLNGLKAPEMTQVYKLTKGSAVKEATILCSYFIGLVYDNGLLELIDPFQGIKVFSHRFS